MDHRVGWSAWRHGLAEEDIVHAFRNPMRSIDLGDGFVMVIGATWSGRLLEIGYRVSDDDPPVAVIVHAMNARPRFVEGW